MNIDMPAEHEFEIQATEIAQLDPAEVFILEGISSELLFRASQIGMVAAKSCDERASWTRVYAKAVGPSGDI
jgi:hypothetical protein